MKQKKKRKKRLGWIVAAAVMLLFAAISGVMLFNASVLMVMRATVRLEDLPPAFEGKTILYIADIDLFGINTPQRASEAIHRLQELSPDMLVLGGDYTAPTLSDLLNQRSVAEYHANQSGFRRDFFYYIRDFQAPLGRYAVLAPDDLLAGDMRPLLQETGFTLLENSRAEITSGGDHIWLVSLDGEGAQAPQMGRSFRRDECVIALCCSPAQFPMLMTSEAGDSGHWVDMALAGHTHDGQIRLLGRTALTLNALERQFSHGWNRETGVPVLTTSGMGCEGVNLRLGTQAEVWLITLTGVGGE